MALLMALGCASRRFGEVTPEEQQAAADRLEADTRSMLAEEDAARGDGDAAAAIGLPSGGPPLVRREPTKTRAQLMVELQGLESLFATTPRGAPDRLKLLRRIAEQYTDLEAAALKDALTAREQGQSSQVASAVKVHATASKAARDRLRQLVDVPGAHVAEAKYLLAAEHLRNDEHEEGRKVLFDITQKHSGSEHVGDAYLLFGELFAEEARKDGSKWPLAKQAYEHVLEGRAKYARVSCYAEFRRGDVLREMGDTAEASRSYRDALKCVDDVPKAAGKSIVLAEADKKIASLSGVSPNAAPAPVAAATPAVDPTLHVKTDERRVALVIGNGGYDSNPLANPPRDARLVAKTLGQLGFDVDLRVDADQAQMKRSIADLGAKLQKGGVGLFYYAGHGVQVNGQNYLVPIKAKIDREQDVDVETVPLNRVLAEMDKARNRVNLVVLDACRDNPFAKSYRSASRGLALSDAPMGTLISYATSPGSVAADGTGQNSPYTAAFVRNMTQKSWQVEDVFKAVRREVKAATNNQQTPWESSSLEGDFTFVP